MMSKHLLYTETPEEAFRYRGYTLKPATYGFSYGTKGKVQAYKVGPFGSVFVNQLLVRSSLEGAATCPFMFGLRRYVVGDISSCSPIICEDMQKKGVSEKEADEAALELFLSDELSSVGMRMPCLYEVPYVNAGNVLKEDKKDDQTYLRVEGDDKPFYYLINLVSPENPKGELPNDWKTMITAWQYSYHYDAEGKRVAISNTRSAYYGLPPNSIALRMPLMRTDIIPELCSLAVGKKPGPKPKGKNKVTKKVAETPKDKKPKVSEPKQAVSKDPEAWLPKLKQFIDVPVPANHKILLEDRSAWRKFCAENEAKDVLGRSKYAVKRLRKPFVGVDNAAEGKVLVDMIRENWSTEIQWLTAIFKWSTLTRWEQGKFYFHQEGKQKGAAAGQTDEQAKEVDQADAVAEAGSPSDADAKSE